MPRQVLIVFTVLMTVCTVLSAEYEVQSPDGVALTNSYVTMPPATIERESHAFDVFRVPPASELADPFVSQSAPEDCQTWRQRLRLDLKPGASTQVVETAVQYFLSTERALAF